MLIRIIGVFASILCAYACYWAVRWSVADYAAKNPSPARIEFALRLAPENPEYYVRLAQADPAQALSAMQRATLLNPLSSSGWIELARASEAHHDLPGAEQSLLRAVQLDKTFAPRWLLAGILFPAARRSAFLACCPRGTGGILR
jgi:cytochrome c-type biogenesis protein CcmH/NrfG